MVATQHDRGGESPGHHITIRLKHALAEVEARVRAVDFKVDFSLVPDWQRRATRLSIAVCFFGMLGHSIPFPPEHKTFASNFRQSCNWAAITCIVVTAPLIGKVAQVAFDRLLGTAVGGFIGFVCYQIGWALFDQALAGAFISFGAAVTIWATTFLAFKRSLDQLARFMQLTYCIVAFGAKPDKGAFMLALLRVGGIFAGGLFSVLLAVLVLPRSASIESLREMKKALKALHDLNREVWALSGVTNHGSAPKRPHRKHHRHGYAGLQERMMEAAAADNAAHMMNGSTHGPKSSASDSALLASGAAGGAGGTGKGLSRHSASARFDLSSDHLDLLVQRDEEMESREAVIEKLFTSVYTTLAKVDDSLAQVKGEIYVWHFYGRYFFLPGVHWFPVKGRWTVPKKDLEDLATCVRRLARMLWTLLLDFEEGFGAEMEGVLQTYYPKQLLSELAEYQSRAIVDLLQAFPNSTHIEVDNLLTLGQVTDCLMQISDARARQTVFQVKRTRRALSTVPSSLAPASTNRSSMVFGGSGVVGGNGGVAGGGGGSGGGKFARRNVEGEGSVTEGGSKTPGGGSVRGSAVGQLSAAGSGIGVPASGLASAVAAATAARRVSQDSQPPKQPETQELEKVPLLARQPTSTSVTSAAGLSTPPTQPSTAHNTPAVSSNGFAVAALSTAPSGKGASVSQAPAGGGTGAGGGGLFISRLLSGTPGAHVTLHLPPRRFVQEQQLLLQHQQQQQQQLQEQQLQEEQEQEEQEQEQDDEQMLLLSKGQRSESAAADAEPGTPAVWLAAAAAPAPAPPAVSNIGAPSFGRSDSIDIFGGADFSFAPPPQPALAATVSAQLTSPPTRFASAGSQGSVASAEPPVQRGALPQVLTFEPGALPDLGDAAGVPGSSQPAQAQQGMPPPPRAPLPPAPAPPPAPPIHEHPGSSNSTTVEGPDVVRIPSTSAGPGAHAAAGLPPRPPALRTPSNSPAGPASGGSGSAAASAPPSLPTIPSGGDLVALGADAAGAGSGSAISVRAGAVGGGADEGGSPFSQMSRLPRFSSGYDPSPPASARPSTDVPGWQRRTSNVSTGANAVAGAGVAAGAGAGAGAGTGARAAGGTQQPRPAASVFYTSAAATATAASIAAGGVAAPGPGPSPATAASAKPVTSLFSAAAAGAGAAAAATAAGGAGFLGQDFDDDLLAGLARGLSGVSGLDNMSTLVVEPVTFPPTEEGYLSQVRWYSFQFVMDEMVEELEEAFFACSSVLRKLPYPIGN